MPKLFGEWVDKTLPTCVFIALQIQAFTTQELVACLWYLEYKRSYTPTKEQIEKVATSKVVMEVLSDDEVDEEVVEVPTNGKLKKKWVSKAQPAMKKTQKGKASRATSRREGEVVGVEVEVLLIASS